MVRSMTGFGTGRADDNGLNVAVEIRCVNNRFLDITFKMPGPLYVYETDIRQLIGQCIQRGRVSVHVSEEWSEEVGLDIEINLPKAQHYARMLRILQSRFARDDTVRLEHLLTFDDLFTTSDDEVHRKRAWTPMKRAVEIALDQLINGSLQEGQALCDDLKIRIATIRNDLNTVEREAAGQVTQYHQRLTERLEELIGDDRIDPDRLEMEIALVADKLDISEEIVRLKSHIDMFEKTLTSDQPVGKTLGFILQEMGREVNTITSKSWMINITQTAVGMKEVIEQIREQVQNIE